MDLPHFEGWHLIGAYPDQEPDDVGSWLLTHNGEALLLEIPPGLAVRDVKRSLAATGTVLRFATASHEHEDHFDVDAWAALTKAFPKAAFIMPSTVQSDRLLHVGGEPVWLIKAPKHSLCDVVTVFRGVAMTGDIELGMLESVNDEVANRVKKRSMKWLAEFAERHNYQVHSIVSAHLNDVRLDVDWPHLFAFDS